MLSANAFVSANVLDKHGAADSATQEVSRDTHAVSSVASVEIQYIALENVCTLVILGRVVRYKLKIEVHPIVNVREYV